jgi:hypothetical protein
MPPEEVLNAFVPEFSGILGNYWGFNNIHFHSEYAGIVVLVLAAAGMFAAGYRRSFRWFWIGTLVISLVWAFGGHTPFYRLVYNFVPYTKYLRAPSAMMFVSMFSVAVLAAMGTERVLLVARSIPNRFLIGWAIGIVALGMIMAGGLPETVAGSVGARIADLYAPPEQRDAVISSYVARAEANQANVLVGALRSIAFALLTLGLIWAVARAKVRPVAAAWGIAALVALDLWMVERQYWIFSPPARVVFATDPAIDAMRAAVANAPGRVVTWAPRGFDAMPRDPAFTVSGDALMVHRLRAVEGYHGNELGRYQQLVASETARSQMAIPVSPAFLAHENVHYLYTTLPDSLMPQLQAPLGWSAPARKIVGPVQNAAGTTVYLYRLPGGNPAAWVASAMAKGTDEQALATVLDPRFDQTRAAILDTATTIEVAPLTTAPAPSGVQARVTRYDPGRIDIQLDKPAPAGAALVVSENFYTGWSGTADGKPAPVARANYNLIGMALPTGSRTVQLRFVDAQYQTGKAITLVALALTLIAILVGIVVDRRQASAVPAPAPAR